MTNPQGNKQAVEQAKRKRIIVALVLNIALFLLVAGNVISYFFVPLSGSDRILGMEAFRYYTTDSNIVAGIASLVMAAYCGRLLRDDNAAVPAWASIFKLAGATVVTVTFLTVIAFLGPVFGFEIMYVGQSFYLHLVCPLLAVISFVFFDPGEPYPRASVWAPVAITFVYAIVYWLHVIVRGTWPDFYGFNMGGMWMVSFVVMMAVVLVLALLLHKGRELRFHVRR